jgi:hypothetical protein
LDYVPEVLIKLCSKTIQSRGFGMFHLENCLSYLILGIRCCKEGILLRRNLGNIMNHGFINRKIPFLRFPKDIFIITSNVRFVLFMANNHTLILNKGMNMFLPISAISD